MIQTDLKRSVDRAVRKDFRRFHASMCRKPQTEVWEECGRIHFYCCLKEYFDYNEKIPMRYYALLYTSRRPIYTLWETYLKYEALNYTTWEGIDGIMEALLEENREAAKERRRYHGHDQDIAC